MQAITVQKAVRPMILRSTSNFRTSRNATTRVNAAAPISLENFTMVDAGRLPDEDRAALAERMGYRQIGKELPDNVTLQDIIRTLPEEVFEINDVKAWSAVLLTLTSVAASVFFIAVSPWYLLPLAWAFASAAWTGFFVVGHDCGHRSFSKNKLVEDIVGTLMFMPLIYPFEPWRIKHNQHHAHTNKLVEDTAWHPVQKKEMSKWSPAMAAVYKTFLGSPLKLWASIGHWAIWHFDLSKYSENQKPRVIISIAACVAFMAIGWPLIINATGWAGFFKFWVMPWLGYHFWMSTFTVIHHTAPFIPFKDAKDWNAAKAQLSGTVHCDFPRWVEILCHDISVHVPHHVNSKIPWYNLRAATDSLRANWGEHMTEATFNWRMMKNIFTECHVYDEQENYVPFDFEKSEPLFELQRKTLPNSM
jgi:omega-6 fatty acid desaturase (delta-12 desaturase)